MNDTAVAAVAALDAPARGVVDGAPSDALKRTVDVVVAIVLVVLTLPVLVLVAATVRITSGPGVLFRQDRVGYLGNQFQMFKFRTMVHDAEARWDALRGMSTNDNPLFKDRQDPRVTAVGRFLRRTSLDELPQLWNVLRGDMSLVGPRPALPREVAMFPPEALVRHSVRPGLTGLWQISGRGDTTFAEYMRCDLEYLARRSIALDLAIILRTIPAVIRGTGSY